MIVKIHDESIEHLKNEKTIIIVTHDMSEIKDESNIIYLGQKRVQQENKLLTQINAD